MHCVSTLGLVLRVVLLESARHIPFEVTVCARLELLSLLLVTL